GPNGAGKTTTIRMMMNIIAPDSGEIKIMGEKFNEKLKDRIGYLPEERGLYRKMKISETLQFFGKLKGMQSGEIKKRGEELLKKFGLFDYYEKKIEELSKGMAQKLQIITTIIHSPDLLILDEPFSGLDPINIELVKDLILEMKRNGITIIFSTHLMDYAEKLVDSIVMVSNGKKVLDGYLSDVKSEYGKKFINIKYEGDGKFVSSLKYIKEFRDYGKEMEIELNDIKDKDKLLKDLISKMSLNSFTLTEPSLNNIFIRNASDNSKGTGE
ncbi:MAG: ATP-binding cassette domain-containing protein, partial [Candidatus Aminicenantes bacterium]|nr:ATP-binding cassette domain-containing protein [Candidatus Aminicenantes bacterium]